MIEYRLVNVEACNIILKEPDIDFFTERINNKFPFAFVRYNHGVWDFIQGLITNTHQSLQVPIDKEYIRGLAKNIPISASNYIKWWGITEESFFEFFDGMISVKPPNLYCGISVRWKKGHFPNQEMFFHPLQYLIINKFLGKIQLYSGGIWKRWVLDNKFQLFMSKAATTKIIVGPFPVKDVLKEMGGTDFIFIEAPISHAAYYIDYLYNLIIKTAANLQYCTIILTCGYIGTILARRLLEKINASIIDIGSALLVRKNNYFIEKFLTESNLTESNLKEPQELQIKTDNFSYKLTRDEHFGFGHYYSPFKPELKEI